QGSVDDTATLDTTAPTLSIDSPIESDNVVNASEATDVLVSGTTSAEDGQEVTVDFSDGVSVVTITASVNGGEWTLLNNEVNLTSLVDTFITVNADVTDAAGNPATSAKDVITLDTTPPTLETVVLDDTEISEADDGNTVTATFTFSEEMDTSVEPIIDNNADTTLTDPINGTWSSDGTEYSLEYTVVDDNVELGNVTFDVSDAMDTAGNTMAGVTSESTDPESEVDTIAPDSPDDIDFVLLEDTISGTAEPGATIKVFDDNGNEVTLATPPEADNNGDWSITISDINGINTAEGVDGYAFTANDSVGNESGKSYLISSWTTLDALRENPEADFTLTQSLTTEQSDYAEFNSDGTGWDPIANFTGNFNGNGFNIEGLTIDKPEVENVGLFETIDGGTVKDVNLVDATIIGGERTASLAGSTTNTTIDNVDVINGQIDGDDFYAAGLVGYVIGGSASEVSFEGNVTGRLSAGGIFGRMDNGPDSDAPILEQAYSKGTVERTDDTEPFSQFHAVGGLVADAIKGATIQNSFSIAEVIGTYNGYTGGIAGRTAFNGTTLENVYAAGELSSEGTTGGLIGLMISGQQINAYYDADVTKRGVEKGSTNDTNEPVGTALNTEQMIGKVAGLDGFDETIWTLVEDQYPILTALEETPQLVIPDPSTVEETPEITNVALTSAVGRENDFLNESTLVHNSDGVLEETQDSVTATITTNMAVEFDTTNGTPSLDLVIGSETVEAVYSGNPDGNTLQFTYTIQAGDNDANGISIPANGLNLNGAIVGDLADLSGESIVGLTFDAVADNSGYKVDTIDPNAPSGMTEEQITLDGGGTTDGITGTSETNSTITVFDANDNEVASTSTEPNATAWQIALSEFSTPYTGTLSDYTFQTTDLAGNDSVIVDSTGNVVTPVVLDLNQDGTLHYADTEVALPGLDGSTTAWAGAEDGVLMWDKHGDGSLSDLD
ncbi:Ig-like domain-containing protein, partial [Salinivibrio sp. HTSP]|uniref:Ig-like domain-containing protein n=1 Tax=Salinivibrio sp. HTSP TaxID=2115977 RepID=UPI0012D83B3E